MKAVRTVFFMRVFAPVVEQKVSVIFVSFSIVSFSCGKGNAEYQEIMELKIGRGEENISKLKG